MRQPMRMRAQQHGIKAGKCSAQANTQTSENETTAAFPGFSLIQSLRLQNPAVAADEARVNFAPVRKSAKRDRSSSLASSILRRLSFPHRRQRYEWTCLPAPRPSASAANRFAASPTSPSSVSLSASASDFLCIIGERLSSAFGACPPRANLLLQDPRLHISLEFARLATRRALPFVKLVFVVRHGDFRLPIADFESRVEYLRPERQTLGQSSKRQVQSSRFKF